MPTPAPTPIRVLVVEDDPVGREILVETLEASGFEVTATPSGEDALRIMRDRSASIDWLFVDIVLPGSIDGWIVGAEFHLSHPRRPIIYASAYKQNPGRRSAGSIFLKKPIRPANIVSLFQELSRQYD